MTSLELQARVDAVTARFNPAKARTDRARALVARLVERYQTRVALVEDRCEDRTDQAPDPPSRIRDDNGDIVDWLALIESAKAKVKPSDSGPVVTADRRSAQRVQAQAFTPVRAQRAADELEQRETAHQALLDRAAVRVCGAPTSRLWRTDPRSYRRFLAAVGRAEQRKGRTPAQFAVDVEHEYATLTRRS